LKSTYISENKIKNVNIVLYIEIITITITQTSLHWADIFEPSIQLLFGYVVARFASVSYISINFIPLNCFSLRIPKFDDLISVLNQRRDFIFYQSPSAFIVSGTRSAFIMIFAHQFGFDKAANLAFAQKFVEVPSRIFTGPFSDLYFKQIFDSSIEQAKSLFIKSVILAVAISCAYSVTILSIGRELLISYMGDGWGYVPIFLACLMPTMVSRIISGPTAKNFVRANQQRRFLFLQCAVSMLILAALWIFSGLVEVNGFIIIYSTITLILSVFLAILSYFAMQSCEKL